MSIQHASTPSAIAALERLMRGRPLWALDFDGTIAPIVARPDDAKTLPQIAQALTRLSARLPIAIVTGRSAQDVKPRLGFEPAFIVGNHGADQSGIVASMESMSVLRRILRHHAWNLAQRDVRVEDKGLSLALHYRLAKDAPSAIQAIEAFVADLPAGYRTFGGKCVVNIVDAAAPDKADAVAALLQRSGGDSVFFAGDDLTDESVFERARPDWLTVRVERPIDTSHAMYYVNSPVELAELIEVALLL